MSIRQQMLDHAYLLIYQDRLNVCAEDLGHFFNKLDSALTRGATYA
jgi:hypothetical protein